MQNLIDSNEIHLFCKKEKIYEQFRKKYFYDWKKYFKI